MADWMAVERCRKPSGYGHRHRLAVLGFCGFALSYAMRFSLSLAIVAMVRHDTHYKSNNVIYKSDVCPHPITSHESVDNQLNLYHVETIFSNNGRTMVVNSTESISYEVSNGTSIPTNGSLSPSSSLYLNGSTGNISSPALPEVRVTPVDNRDMDEEQGEFSWSEADQGLILGSFFWGYVLTQCFGGWISQRIGGKKPFGFGLLITGIFSILTPVAARYGGMNWLIFVRIVQGLAGGVTVPSMQSILSKWFPPEERGKLGSFTLAGMPFGTSMCLLCSGYLIHFFHWPSVFYVTGLMTVLWWFLWTFFAHASPFDDPTIDQAELRYIHDSLHRNGGRGGKQLKVPWTQVLFSLPFWAILICNTCETWGLYTINSELPTYMKTVLRFDIKQNSVMSAFPHLLTLVVSVILTNIGDNLIERQYMSIGTVRKLSTSIAMWGSAAALFGVAYSGCDRVKTVALLAAAIGLNGGKFGGFLVNIIDIAPNYAGILMGIINTISSMPGFFAPWVAGMIINDNPSLDNWRLVFLITAGISFVGNIFYIVFASGVEQTWNRMSVDVNDESNGNVNKSFQNDPHAFPLENINQAIISNTIIKDNVEEAVVYIIPLNSDRNNGQEMEERRQQALPLHLDGPHILPPVIDNFDEGQGQMEGGKEFRSRAA